MAAQNDYEQMTKMGQIENQQGTFETSCVAGTIFVTSKRRTMRWMEEESH